MAETSSIEWTDATWNPIVGCSVISPGCKRCYAMKLAGTRMKNHFSRAGLTEDTKAGPVWTGEVRFINQWLTQPLHWRRPRRIFVCAHADLFHERVPDAWIDLVFAVMGLASHHDFQVLTKRSARMLAYFKGRWAERVMEHLEALKPSSLWNGNVFQARHELSTKGFLPNVWLGVSAEDQARLDERWPDLAQSPAAKRFLSLEPLLEAVDPTRISTMRFRGAEILNALTGELSGLFGDPCGARLPRVDLVIVGGESGRDARPMHPDWARAIRDACAAAGVPFLFKQWGAWAPVRYDASDRPTFEPDIAIARNGAIDGTKPFTLPRTGGDRPRWAQMALVGKKAAGRMLDGVIHDGLMEIAA